MVAVALLDGIALTSLRTPAVSALAARHLAAPDATSLVVFGTGPQARGHVDALRAVRAIESVVVVGRDPQRARAFAASLDLPAAAGSPDAVADAAITVCATTAVEPLFDGRRVPAGVCVIAVGSHEPHVRELDTALMRRAHVVVEDEATARREAGDVIQAGPDLDLIGLATLVRGEAALDPNRPRVFKSVGMGWEDLALADAVYQGAA